MSWNNFNIPPTISEIAVDERLQQEQQQAGGGGGINGANSHPGPSEESDDASTDTIRALQDSKLEPLMISMLEQRDKLQDQV
jgi:hypothetical protein